MLLNRHDLDKMRYAVHDVPDLQPSAPFVSLQSVSVFQSQQRISVLLLVRRRFETGGELGISDASLGPSGPRYGLALRFRWKHAP